MTRVRDLPPGRPIMWGPEGKTAVGETPLQWAVLRAIAEAGAPERVASLSSNELEGRSDRDLAISIVLPIIETPRLARGPVPTYREEYEGNGRWVPQPDGSNDKELSHLFLLGWPVEGRADLLEHWPTEADAQPPTAAELREDVGGDSPHAEFTLDGHIVWSWVEVFESDQLTNETLERGEKRRSGQLVRYLDAMNEAVERCVDKCVDSYTRTIAQRRRHMAFHGRAREGVILNAAPRIKLETQQTETVNDLVVELASPRLQDASFDAVVSKIVEWGREIERYSRFLGRYTEDALSASLCAALSLVFGAADHDTFVHNGHPDVVINSAKLMAMRDRILEPTESDLFVAEAKLASGAAAAKKARRQLDNYLTRSARHGALIFYIKTAPFNEVFQRMCDELASSPSCHSEPPAEIVDRCCQLVFTDALTKLDVTVAIIGIPLATTDSQGKEADKRAAAS